MKVCHVNDELKRMWKEAIVVKFQVLSMHLPKKTTKNLRIAGIRAEI
jgi:hypothetical protein